MSTDHIPSNEEPYEPSNGYASDDNLDQDIPSDELGPPRSFEGSSV